MGHRLVVCVFFDPSNREAARVCWQLKLREPHHYRGRKEYINSSRTKVVKPAREHTSVEHC